MHRLFRSLFRLSSVFFLGSLISTNRIDYRILPSAGWVEISKPFIVEAAYPNWIASTYPPENIPLNYLQQIGHVFVWPGDGGELVIPGDFLVPQLIELAHSAEKEILVGVGGGNRYAEMAAMVSDPAKREIFVNDLTDFVMQYDYDGVEIDWEYPQTSLDRENLNSFMAELRNSLDESGQNLQLNLIVSGNEWFGQWIDVNSITPFVDYYLVITFGFYHMDSRLSGHNSPLYPPSSEVSDAGSVDGTIHYWTESRGIAKSKIFIGLASFGNSFDSEDLYQPFTTFRQAYYRDIKPLIGNGYTRHWDDISKVPYLTQDDGLIVWSYDDPTSFGIKCDYVKANGLAGVAVWEMSGDLLNGEHELLETVAFKLMLSHAMYLPFIHGRR